MKKQQTKKSALTAGLLSLVLLITGTFAWTSISQKALNEVKIESESGGRVHDDFNKEGVEDGSITDANKDIYAENYGDTALFVRIKLSEFLQIGDTVITGGNKDDRTTWIPYVLGNTENARDYVDWTMGGDKIFLPTFNKDNQSLITDVTGDAIEGTTGEMNTAIGDGSHDYFVNNPDAITDIEQYRDEDGELVSQEATHEPKSTLIQDRGVISMEEWKAAGKPTGKFWVIDIDGWAYWAEMLQPGEATSLLLNELHFKNLPDDNMYYAIDVIGEFASASDIDKLIDGSVVGSSPEGLATSDAEELLYVIAGNIKYSLEITPNEAEVKMSKEESKQFSAKVMKTYGTTTTEVTGAEITWTLDAPVTRTVASTVNPTGLVSIAANETNELLELTASAVGAEYNLSKKVNIRVFIIPKTAGAKFEDPETGLLWRVLVPDDGSGNALIITENTFDKGAKYNDTNVYSLFENSVLYTTMQDWYANDTYVGHSIRTIGLDYAYQNNSGTTVAKKATGAGIEYDDPASYGSWNASANVQRARTKAGAIATKGNGQVFALSISEVNEYFANDGDRKSMLYGSTSNIHWWLRSPGSSSSFTVDHVHTNGNVTPGASASNTGLTYRPALWVKR